MYICIYVHVMCIKYIFAQILSFVYQLMFNGETISSFSRLAISRGTVLFLVLYGG